MKWEKSSFSGSSSRTGAWSASPDIRSCQGRLDKAFRGTGNALWRTALAAAISSRTEYRQAESRRKLTRFRSRSGKAIAVSLTNSTRLSTKRNSNPEIYWSSTGRHCKKCIDAEHRFDNRGSLRKVRERARKTSVASTMQGTWNIVWGCQAIKRFCAWCERTGG